MRRHGVVRGFEVWSHRLPREVLRGFLVLPLGGGPLRWICVRGRGHSSDVSAFGPLWLIEHWRQERGFRVELPSAGTSFLLDSLWQEACATCSGSPVHVAPMKAWVFGTLTLLVSFLGRWFAGDEGGHDQVLA